MIKQVFKSMIAIALAAVMVASANAQTPQSAEDNYVYDPSQGVRNPRIDRYLDVEVWTNHGDGEYYVGDNVTIQFRASRDAFIAIYSIDSKDRVSLLFPANPGDDNFVRGGVTYRIPDGYADYDLVVSGPEGVENIQIIASRERFSIPDWYGLSGLVFDWEDRFDYMDYLNQRYFVRYDGQKFAYDRTAIYVNEWEPYYFEPVYYPSYPSWTVYGNSYIDYPYGSSVYIDGIYWGCTPLYIPYIYAGWHTFSIYDSYGYGWENDIHISRYNTLVLDRNVISTSPNMYSKYKKVRQVGYRAPASNGYPNYTSKVAKMKSSQGKIVLNGKTVNNKQGYRASTTKKYSRGEAKLVKTKRGWESSGPVISTSKSRSGKSYGRSSWSNRKGSASGSKKGYSSTSKSSGHKADYRGNSSSRSGSGKSTYGQRNQRKYRNSKKSSGYYQRKSGSSKQKTSTGSKQYRSKSSSKGGRKSGSGAGRKAVRSGSGKSSGRSSSVKSSGRSKSSPPARKSGGGRSKSSGSRGKSRGGGK